MKAIRACVEKDAGGKVAYESLLVEELSPSVFKLMASPGLILGLAKGDVFKLDEESKPYLLSRGSNVVVQIFKDEGISNKHLEIEEAILESLYASSLDGITEQLLVFTVPVSEGFSKIESILNDAITRYPGYRWYYGNVYDPADGITPLNWWKTNE